METRLTESGAPLKTFIPGTWWKNPGLSKCNNDDGVYYRVSRSEQVDNGDYWYNSVRFDQVVDKDWNIIKDKDNDGHCNCNWEDEMTEVIPPYVEPHYEIY